MSREPKSSAASSTILQMSEAEPIIDSPHEPSNTNSWRDFLSRSKPTASTNANNNAKSNDKAKNKENANIDELRAVHSLDSLDAWRLLITSAIALGLNGVAFALNIILPQTPNNHTHNGNNNTPVSRLHVFPPALIGMVAAILALASVALDVTFLKVTIKCDDKSPRAKGLTTWPLVRPAIRQTVCFLAFVPVIVTLVILTLLAIDSDGGSGYNRYAYLSHLKTMPRGTLIILDCMAVVSDLALCAATARLVWWPVHRAARSSMISASLLQLAVATILIAVNWRPYLSCFNTPWTYITATVALHQHVGGVLFATAMFSFLICCAMKKDDRIDKVFTRFIVIYTVLAAFCCILLFILLGLGIHLVLDEAAAPFLKGATLSANPILVGSALALFLVNFWACYYLQEPPPSSLAVEPIDLADLTPTQRQAFAKLIDRHGRSMPDAPSGDGAISLMQAYCSASMPSMKCTVLRVYKPSKVVDKTVLLNRMVTDYTYEDDWAWRSLDVVEQTAFRRNTLIEKEKEDVPQDPPKLTKSQQKKLARKREEAIAKGLPITPAVEIDPKAIQQELEFRQKLECTEALVMMTQIENYDLTGSVKGWAGDLLRKTLGAESPFKPLCVRLGLLAFHFPFRSSTFYTTHAKRPVARSAAVLRAIAEWNSSRPSKERCTMLLHPTYEHGEVDRAIIPSGWQSTPLPASHVIDLRPYKNKTVAEYLKAIKYRDQEGNFKKAKGEVIETTEFTPEECKEAMRLWHHIAEKRTSDGETAVLVTPDEEMLMQLGLGAGHNAKGDRSLMFLRVDGVNVASCVLFRLGDTITSDIQGLDHDLARPLKAYFVMMQHVIAIALKEGRSFVDFGPTTAKPKMDIGCKEIGLNGAMYATSPIIRFAIGIAVGNTRRALVEGADKEKEKEKEKEKKEEKKEEEAGREKEVVAAVEKSKENQKQKEKEQKEKEKEKGKEKEGKPTPSPSPEPSPRPSQSRPPKQSRQSNQSNQSKQSNESKQSNPSNQPGQANTPSQANISTPKRDQLDPQDIPTQGQSRSEPPSSSPSRPSVSQPRASTSRKSNDSRPDLTLIV